VSVVGNDEAGSELRTKLNRLGVNADSVVTADNLQTTTKVRILAGHAHSNRQQVIRIDYEDSPITDADVRSKLLSELKRRTSDASAVIVSDYNYGVVDDAEVEFLRTIRKSIPVLVDSRFRLTSLTGLTAATPNEDELEQIIKEPIKSRQHLEAAATELQRQLNYQALLVTRGPQGMMLLEGGSQPLHIAAVGAAQPVDVTGAGDTVIATFALSLASGASFSEAARLANYAGGLVVMKRGTASVTRSELEHSIINSEN
jgi:rfaE bifunctional protein kinase chain/domain